MFEKIKELFKAPKESENIYNLIQSSEQRQTGWYRVVDPLDRFIGYSWHCPGRISEARSPRPREALPMRPKSQSCRVSAARSSLASLHPMNRALPM